MADQTNEIDVKIVAATENVQQAATEVKNLADGAQSIVESFSGVAEAFAGAFAIDKVEEFSRSISDLGEQVERTAKMTGLTTDAVQDFQYAVKMSGGDSDSAAQSLERLERNMAEAAAGSKTAQAAFAAAGVSAKTIASGNVNEALAEMSTRFSETADGANKTAIAMAIAGRGGASLIPILDQGPKALKAFNAALDETNSRLTGGQVEAFSRTAQEFKTLEAASAGVADQIETRLNPGIDGAIAGMIAMKEQFSEAIKEGGAFADAIDGLGDALMAIVAVVDTVKTGFAGLFDIAGGYLDALGDKARGVAQVIIDLFHRDIPAAITDFAVAEQKASEDIQKGFIDATEEGNKLLDVINKMNAAHDKGIVGKDAAEQGPKKPPPALPSQDKSQDDDSAAQRSLLTEKYDTEKEMDSELVSLGKMTNEQKFSDLHAYLDQTESAVNASYDAQAKQYATDSVEYKKVLDQKSVADEKFTIESMKLTQEAAEDSEKRWTSAINTFDTTFSQMLRGVLQGTQSIEQAFAKMAGNMVISFASAIGQILIKNGALWAAQQLGFTQLAGSLTRSLGEWVIGESTKTSATTAGEAIRTSEATAASAEAATAAVASSRVQIAAYAGVYAAAASASVAAIPFVGWAMAPAVGTEALAQGLAYEAFDVGTPNVPRDMLAQIHQGEAIIPQKQAQAWRDGDLGLGAPTGDVHLHVHALDRKDVQSYLKKNSGMVARAVSAGVRGGYRGQAR